MLSTVGIVTFRKERSVVAKSLSEVSALVSLTFYEIFLIRQEKCLLSALKGVRIPPFID